MAGAEGPLWKRLLWFVALWAAGVAAVGAVGFVIRLALS
jgi:preprotein translocase subunit Sss1